MDQLIDESQVITGWCNNGSDDKCPPGCIAAPPETDYPLIPPSDLNLCWQVNKSWTKAAFKLHKAECNVTTTGNNGKSYEIYDSNGDYIFSISDAYGGTFNGAQVIASDDKNVFFQANSNGGLNTSLFRKSLIAPYDHFRVNTASDKTLFINNWNFHAHVSHGLWGVSGNYYLEGTEYRGCILLNYNLEYVTHYGEPTTGGGKVVTYLNGKLYHIKGTEVDVRSASYPHDYIKTINVPHGISSTWDLGTYDGKTLYAMCTSDRFSIYTDDDVFVATIIEPNGLPYFGWCDNSGPARYGNFIMAGSPNASSHGYTLNGAIYMYTTEGKFVKTLGYGEGGAPGNNLRLGAGVSFTDKAVLSSASNIINESSSGYIKMCKYNNWTTP